MRYRYDTERRKRIKTVELVEEEAEWVAPGLLYLVQIDWQETALREKGSRSARDGTPGAGSG